MKRILVAVFAANLALLVAAVQLLPDRVAMHFGPGGEPDRWGDRMEYVIVMSVVLVVCSIVAWFPVWINRRMPDAWFNLPNKDYWLRDENRTEMYRRLDRIMLGFGTAILLFFFGVQVLVLAAHYQDPVRLNSPLMLTGLGLLGVYIIYFNLRLLRAFRIPK